MSETAAPSGLAAAGGMAAQNVYAPLGLLAELTHRCPLGCPYCSNPVALEGRTDELDTATWARVFKEAAALGVLQVHLSGGEPAARRDLIEITAAAHQAGLYTNLITSAVGVTEKTFTGLVDAGLDHVQISIQDNEPGTADHIAGYKGAYARKRALAAEVVRHKVPLTINAVMHRANIDHIEEMVALALELGASRVEIAHVQYYGWALKNRGALMPTLPQVERAARVVEELRQQHHGKIVIDAVVPDYYARYPKACVGGWGRRSLNVTPSGKVLPCHAAETIPGLEFWSVREHSLSDIWLNSPAFNAFRGTDWMPDLCKSCPRRDIDFGGCRCQALALTGDARATDPVCHLSPHHALLADLAAERIDVPYDYRRQTSPAAPAPKETEPASAG
jgi:pyrroloquinoline quinone biosynthesis protein E